MILMSFLGRAVGIGEVRRAYDLNHAESGLHGHIPSLVMEC